jgi:hypothetical protein
MEGASIRWKQCTDSIYVFVNVRAEEGFETACSGGVLEVRDSNFSGSVSLVRTRRIVLTFVGTIGRARVLDIRYDLLPNKEHYPHDTGHIFNELVSLDEFYPGCKVTT